MCCSRSPPTPATASCRGRSRDEMIAGARVEVAPYKRDPGRFRAVEAVRAGSAGLGQPVGARPAGLAYRMLGDERGASRRDLRHPRRRPRPDLPAPRERDRAERVRASAAGPLCAIWMHNGFLTRRRRQDVEIARQFLHRARVAGRRRRARRSAWRCCRRIIATRSIGPTERLRQARHSLDRFYRALTLSRDPVFERFGEADEALRPVKEALEDDLNTPLALARLHELVGAINRTSSDAARSALQRALEEGGRLMGLLEQDPLDWLRGSARADERRIEEQIALRALPHAGSAALPRPTRSAPASPPRASSSKTSPTAPPPGGARTERQPFGFRSECGVDRR